MQMNQDVVTHCGHYRLVVFIVGPGICQCVLEQEIQGVQARDLEKNLKDIFI